jgi:hypothetical protein
MIVASYIVVGMQETSPFFYVMAAFEIKCKKKDLKRLIVIKKSWL